jgi:hypothetical protein
MLESDHVIDNEMLEAIRKSFMYLPRVIDINDRRKKEKKKLNLDKFEEILKKEIQEGIFDNISFTHERVKDGDFTEKIKFMFDKFNSISVNEFKEILIRVAELNNEHLRLVVKLQKIIQEVKENDT